MVEVPSYIRNHIHDLERTLARIRAKAEELRTLPPSSETVEALRDNALVAESIERTLSAARGESPLLSDAKTRGIEDELADDFRTESREVEWG